MLNFHSKAKFLFDGLLLIAVPNGEKCIHFDCIVTDMFHVLVRCLFFQIGALLLIIKEISIFGATLESAHHLI